MHTPIHENMLPHLNGFKNTRNGDRGTDGIFQQALMKDKFFSGNYIRCITAELDR